MRAGAHQPHQAALSHHRTILGQNLYLMTHEPLLGSALIEPGAAGQSLR